jgi:hypothetical protein
LFRFGRYELAFLVYYFESSWLMKPTNRGKNDTRRYYLVEFFGPSGCGKSTVARELAKGIPDPCISREDLLRPGGKAAGYSMYLRLPVIYPVISFWLLRLAYSTAPNNWSEMARFCNAFLLHKYWLDRALARQEANVIYDQGLLQAIWTILFDAKPRDCHLHMVRKLCRMSYQNRKVKIVWFRCCARVAAERLFLRKRGRSRLDGLGLEDISESIQRNQWIFGIIEEGLRAEKIPWLEIDADGALEENVSLLVEGLSD